jgi:NADPH:quinone reductase-like Zn-dependent oxidoreductase
VASARIAVQVAKALGAVVTGVCSTTKVDLVRSLGADHVVDYTAGVPVPEGEHFDLIVDIAGNTPLKRLRSMPSRRGTLVIVGGEGAGRVLGIGRQLRAVRCHRSSAAPGHARLGERHTRTWNVWPSSIDSGAFVPVIERVYPLEEARWRWPTLPPGTPAASSSSPSDRRPRSAGSDQKRRRSSGRRPRSSS